VAGGELEETFQVKESGLNEIFIDLLYASDQKNVSGSGRTNSGVSINTSSNSPVPKEVEMKNAKETERFVIGSLLANMSTVDGGSFIMGNNRAPSGDEAEHTVTIKPILFGIYEVTQKQWETIMGYNPSDNKGCGTCPVENVSWEEAMKFIQKINSLSDKRFRLPTEAEWEYVAKYGGKAEVDQYGGQEEFIKATGWYYANSDKKTHPVGQKAPNASGIYDLIGNVSEWCYDWYSPDYFKEQSSQKNPEGPPLGKEKIVRGTSYNDYLGDRFRPSLRNKLKPVTKSKEIGFRLVLDRY
jgi:formylglycine-generating enzyme required for sulfatase activity